MKAILKLTVCLLLTGVSVFAQQNSGESADKSFAISAADGGMLEVKLGELALKKATMPETKEFGKMMITDHKKVNAELKSLAGKKKITLPTQLSRAKQQLYDSLATFNGEQFDMMYMNMMIASHEETIGLFQTESNDGSDQDFRKWADSKIPALKHHLEKAKALFPDNLK
jgi:putative membrane protein